MRHLLCSAAVALAMSGCAGSLPGPVQAPERHVEQVTPTMWAAAQREATRISGGRLELSDAPPVLTFTLSHDALCELRGRCVEASYVPPQIDGFAARAYFSAELRWRSDLYAQSTLVHEAAHSMQDPTRPAAALEREAYTIQAAWLDEQGAFSDANEVLAKRDRRYPAMLAELEG